MKKSFLILAIMALLSLGANAQTKKDGTPDMRYKANKELYGNSYSTPSSTTPSYSTPSFSEPKQERNYDNGGQLKLQDGYLKSNGTYVEPHLKTTPDNNKLNNLNDPE
ncbi:MAG: hypothetical protein NTU43_12865 [Bacteroidetes bacterium]|nr:hypothetical protein [Bacteroidota bacterium]